MQEPPKKHGRTSTFSKENMTNPKINNCFFSVVNIKKMLLYTYAQTNYENNSWFCRKRKDELKKLIFNSPTITKILFEFLWDFKITTVLKITRKHTDHFDIFTQKNRASALLFMIFFLLFFLLVLLSFYVLRLVCHKLLFFSNRRWFHLFGICV